MKKLTMKIPPERVQDARRHLSAGRVVGTITQVSIVHGKDVVVEATVSNAIYNIFASMMKDECSAIVTLIEEV